MITFHFDSRSIAMEPPLDFAPLKQWNDLSEETPSLMVMGVPLDRLTMTGALQRIEQMVASRKPHYIVTANADFLVQAMKDAELHRILLEADLVLCDGTPLVWASRWLGNPLPERVAGSDLAPLLVRLAAEKKYRIFLLGASPEANAQAARRLKERHPSLHLVGNFSPPFKSLEEMDHKEIKRRIKAAQPDLLLVAFGCPKQEKWMAMHYRFLGVPVSIGMGGTLDFLAGRLKRAPYWMQRAGIEWVFRLLQEPRRLFRRYAMDLWHFGKAVLAQYWWMQWRRGGPRMESAHPVVFSYPSRRQVQARGWLDIETIRHSAHVWRHVCSGDCILDLSEVTFIDSTGINWLVGIQKKLHQTGYRFILTAPSVSVQRALALMKLEDFFKIAENSSEAKSLIEAHNLEKTAPLRKRFAIPLFHKATS